MAFEDLAELVEPLELPIRGKTYTLPLVSIDDGIRLKSVLDGEPDDTITDDDVKRILLGDVLAQLKADGVSDEWVGRVLLTALADFRSGRFQAEIMWKTGGDPKAIEALIKSVAPNRAAKRASRPTVAASTTKVRASSSGTKTSRGK